MRLRAVLMLVALVLAPVTASAVQPDEMLSDPALEARARHISAGLRCLVCQNQSIDDSDAPLARDLRLIVREKISAGKTDSEVVDFVVARYGQYVLLRPRFDAVTAILWIGPFAILLLGALGIYLSWRQRRTQELFLLSDEEEARLEKLLKDSDQVTKV